MELDGETNLKPRRALEATNILADDIDTFMKGIHDKALEATVNPLATLSS